jgi:hypothetical protein
MTQVVKLASVFTYHDTTWMTSFYYFNQQDDMTFEQQQDLLNAFATDIPGHILAVQSAETVHQGIVLYRIDPKIGIPYIKLDVRSGLVPGLSNAAISACCISHYPDPTEGGRSMSRNYISGVSHVYNNAGRWTDSFKPAIKPFLDALKIPLVTSQGDWFHCSYGKLEEPYTIKRSFVRPQLANIRSRLPTSILS